MTDTPIPDPTQDPELVQQHETNSISTVVALPVCEECDNHQSEGKGLSPDCMEGLTRRKCADLHRFIRRGTERNSS